MSKIIFENEIETIDDTLSVDKNLLYKHYTDLMYYYNRMIDGLMDLKNEVNTDENCKEYEYLTNKYFYPLISSYKILYNSTKEQRDKL